MSSMLPSDQNNQKKGKPEPFNELIKSMNNFFNEKPVKGFLQTIDDFFRSPFPPGSAGAFSVKTIDNGEEYIVTAELPGIKKEQIHLDLYENLLTITVDNKQVSTEKDEVNNVFRQSQFWQQSSRTVSLPRPVKEKNVKAAYQDGLLEIRIRHDKGKTIQIDG
ncbi:Hsp20/alpha crystallin family protein [Neobacillus sp. SM06]|uniref:Hsp20/alpha crystallin family protein n=1 Tax=Neobacillus sp. SM06 TaxID=3422492 RepID=UPI003D27CA8F